MRRGGFTLLEALAAVVTLGLLAAIVVPLLRQFGHLAISDKLQAQVYLGTLVTQGDHASGTTHGIAGHADWNLVISELIAEPEPAPPSGSTAPAAPPHHWVRVCIRTDGSGETLAETLVAVLP